MNQSMKSKTRRSKYAYVPSRFKQGSSTGARISTGRPGLTSPRGGFYQSAYEAGKSIASYYGYDPERYVKDRLTSPKHKYADWRNKYLLGRKHYNHNASFPWLPRFPKKDYIPYKDYEVHRSSSRGIRRSRPASSEFCERCRQRYSRPVQRYRRGYSKWLPYRKVRNFYAKSKSWRKYS